MWISYFLKILFWGINLIVCKYLREVKGQGVDMFILVKQKEKKEPAQLFTYVFTQWTVTESIKKKLIKYSKYQNT